MDCFMFDLNANSQSRRFQNRNDWNDISFRGCSQNQFNYNGHVPHHGWDFHYAGGTFVPYQTSGPTIPAVRPLHWPQPVAYCKICEVKVGNFKNVETHNNGKKHRRMLNLHEELERLRISNRQIPNSQVNVVVQPMTVLKSGKNGCPEKNVSSEATVAKHRNYLQKDIGVTPEVPAEGKPRDKTSAQGHNFKHKIGGGKIGKYMKKNDGLRRPLESCIHAPADSNIYTQADCENQNCTDEIDNHLLPSVVVEFNSPSGSVLTPKLLIDVLKLHKRWIFSPISLEQLSCLKCFSFANFL